MNKSTKYLINGALIIGMIGALYNIYNQFEADNKNAKFKWNDFFIIIGKSVVIGGILGFLIGMFQDNKMSKILLKTGGAAGLIKILLERYSKLEEALPNKAKKIQNAIYNEFSEMLTEYPSIGGSFTKGTAIENSDVDIPVRFKKDFGRLDHMKDTIEIFFKNKFSDRNLVQIRSQNHSVGLIFDINKEKRRIDIVPMREIENGKGDTFIFSSETNSIKKTNISKQNTHLKFTAKQKEIIKFLKGWKKENEIKIPSIYIEYLIKKIFDENQIPKGIYKTLTFILEYIANNITSIRLVDQTNSNNIISNLMTYDEKREISSFCNDMLYNVRKDERNLLDYCHYE